VGLISYSLYLVHWPLVVFTRFLQMRRLEPLEIMLIIAASIIIAVSLYVLVERPLRRMPAQRVLVFALALVAIGATAMAGVIGPRLNLRLNEAAQKESLNQEPVETYRRAWREAPCLLVGDPDYRVWRRENCVRTNGAGGDILLWGDSFAAHYTPGLEGVDASIPGSIVQYTAQGCPPILSYHTYIQPHCRDFNRRALSIIASQRIRRVVLAANWSEYDRREVEKISSTLEALERLGVETVLIGQSPAFFMAPSLTAARRGWANAPTASVPLGVDAAGLNSMLRERALASRAEFIDPMPHLCPRDPCPIRIDGKDLYLDYGHFTLAGSARAVRAYFPYVAR
jgi:hypothetical protein